MKVGKFRGIVEKSLAAVPELAEPELKVEFGHSNNVLQLLSIRDVQAERVVVALGEESAACKPLLRAGLTTSAGTMAGCGPNASKSGCCAPAKPQASSCCA